MIQDIKKYDKIYTIKEINGKTIVIFESHNMALPIWGLASSEYSKKCRLISFDSHADTNNPFNLQISRDIQESEKRNATLTLPTNTDRLKYIPYEKREDGNVNVPSIDQLLFQKKYMSGDFSFDDVVIISDKIQNDEQIKIAYLWDYISYYAIITRNRHDREDIMRDFKEHERWDTDEGYNCAYLEATELHDFISSFSINKSQPVIVDFDMDYFINRQVLDSNMEKAIQFFIRNAVIITIAKESSSYFNNCRTDTSFNVEDALQQLLKVISK